MSALMKPVVAMLDKKRTLRLTLKGMLAFEEITGKNLLKNLNIKDFSLKDSAALIWACLIDEDPDLTFEACKDMIDFSNIIPVMTAVNKCIVQSMTEMGASKTSPLVKKSPHG